MYKKRERKIKATMRLVADINGDACILFCLLKPLINKERALQGKPPTTQREVVGALITAYCLSHRDDILGMLDEEHRPQFEEALRRHSVRTQFPRPHRGRPRAALAQLPVGGADTGAPGEPAPATAAGRHAAAE